MLSKSTLLVVHYSLLEHFGLKCIELWNWMIIIDSETLFIYTEEKISLQR